ncbi:hypothetical protein TrRE_jg3825 [Triparma retinervis]|uniref:Uncharacterized protein n=1 Tax=Triparma retinervis TaxID=2557542 RepID=A0A9W7AHQ0_9STRA|nr:hypothetical protein TrRE_jg3825 [Triparma retinervis]
MSSLSLSFASKYTSILPSITAQTDSDFKASLNKSSAETLSDEAFQADEPETMDEFVPFEDEVLEAMSSMSL